MAKSSKRRSKAKAQTAQKDPVKLDRRGALRLIRNGGIAAAVVVGAGVFGTRSVMATIAEHDLTRLGAEGKPVIVQIHDPSCPMCRSLQKETRKALGRLEECAIVYLVANIRTEEGAAFAAKYGAPHVTLLLFDASGELQDTLTGERDRDALEARFLRHSAT
ncbi:MAG: thioredoxin family protein [Pseudomonadota bacterium]